MFLPPRVSLFRRPLPQPNPEKPRPLGRKAPAPAGHRPAAEPLSYQNPVLADPNGRDHGDPFVMEHLGTYYLYHTGRDGVRLYSSPDLVRWRSLGVVLGPEAGHWAEVDFWAPEVMYAGGVFYLYVAATRRKPSGRGDDKGRRLGVARGLRPEGPFVWQDEPLVDWEWAIDGHPYRDEDGGLWMFYNVRTEATRYHDGSTGCGNVVSRMSAPDRLERVQHPVAYPSHRWEGNRRGDWYWNEGPCVLKRRGTYFQMYSGGCYADDTYGLGFTTADNPRGPWRKESNLPILKSSRGVLGPGHHCVVSGPDGVTPYVVYHGYLPGQRGRKVHLDRLFWAGDRPVVAGPTRARQAAPAGPVYDPAVPHWGLSAWVSGRAVRVGDATIPLAADGPRRLRVLRRGRHTRAYLEGVLAFDGPAAGDAVEADGELRDVRKTSWLDDEGTYTLSAGERRRWDWGGQGDLEVSLALRGRALIRAGDQALEVCHGRYELVRLGVQGGAEGLEVSALEGEVAVTDVVMTARSR